MGNFFETLAFPLERITQPFRCDLDAFKLFQRLGRRWPMLQRDVSEKILRNSLDFLRQLLAQAGVKRFSQKLLQVLSQ